MKRLLFGWNNRKNKPEPTHVLVDDKNNIIFSGTSEECVREMKRRIEQDIAWGLEEGHFWIQPIDFLN